MGFIFVHVDITLFYSGYLYWTLLMILGHYELTVTFHTLHKLIFFQVHAEEISGNNGYLELSFCAKKLDDKVQQLETCFGKHSMFYTWLNSY